MGRNSPRWTIETTGTSGVFKKDGTLLFRRSEIKLAHQSLTWAAVAGVANAGSRPLWMLEDLPVLVMTADDGGGRDGAAVLPARRNGGGFPRMDGFAAARRSNEVRRAAVARTPTGLSLQSGGVEP